MDFAQAMRRQWWIVVLVAVTAAMAAASWSLVQPRTYEATATVVIQPQKGLAAEEVLNALYPLDRSRIVPTYADIASSEFARVAAAERAAIPTAEQEDYLSESLVLPESLAVRVRATGPDRQLTLTLLQQVIAVSSERFVEAYQVFEVGALVSPNAPTDPVSPVLWRAIAAALVLGALVGTATVAGLAQLARRSAPGPQTYDLAAREGPTAAEA